MKRDSVVSKEQVHKNERLNLQHNAPETEGSKCNRTGEAETNLRGWRRWSSSSSIRRNGETLTKKRRPRGVVEISKERRKDKTARNVPNLYR